jgi:hypothetical protein
MTREELIAALERAEGPSRELDEAIDYMALEQGWRQERPTYHGLAYTSSLDAALTLVPDELWRSILHAPPFGRATVSLRTGGITDPKTTEWMGNAITPASALCIAAIRARGEAGDA